MKYQITHTTTYTYSQAVSLKPHELRLRPRCDGAQSLQSFALDVTPNPSQITDIIDLGGNSTVQLRFSDELTDHLEIKVSSTVETYRTNPFAFLLEPWAVQLPIDYPASLLFQVQPYLAGQFSYCSQGIDPVAFQLAQEVYQTVGGNTVSFLTELNQRINQTCQYTFRQTGEPLPAGVTWTQKSGSCRDVAVLFVEVCRAIALPARFVSGYQQGDLDRDDRQLHAWAEVYLPGAGWRGFDPTQGMAVADQHVALVATVSSRDAAPVSGNFKQEGKAARSQMDYHLTIDLLTET